MWTQRWERWIYKPRSAQGYEPGREAGNGSSEPREDANPVYTSIFDSSPPGLGNINFCSCKLLHFVMFCYGRLFCILL